MERRQQELYTIPTGTILYRAAPNICNYSHPKIFEQLRKCNNTGKCGIYFSTYIFQALAMTIEYKKDMELGIFQTTSPITVAFGKYANFLSKIWYGNNYLKSHINQMYPILNKENNSKYNFNLNYDEGEVFISDPDLLKSIKLIDTYYIHHKELEKYIKSVNHISLRNKNIYLKSPIIKKINCNNTKKNKINTSKNLKLNNTRKHRNH